MHSFASNDLRYQTQIFHDRPSRADRETCRGIPQASRTFLQKMNYGFFQNPMLPNRSDLIFCETAGRQFLLLSSLTLHVDK